MAVTNYVCGMPKAEIIKIFSIGMDTLNRWIRKYKNTGRVEAEKQTKHRKRKFSDEQLVEFIEKNPSAILKNISEHFSVCHQSVHKRFKLIGMTRKKRHFYTKKGMDQKEQSSTR